MARRFRRLRRRPRRFRRRRSFRRRRAGYRRGRGVQYDGAYKAKCTIVGSLQTIDGAGYSLQFVGWGMAPSAAANISEVVLSPEFNALRQNWREYRIMGVKYTFVPAAPSTTAVQVRVLDPGAVPPIPNQYVQGSNFGMDKGSFQNMVPAATLAIGQPGLVSCYDYKFANIKAKTSYYIKLSRFWAGINGQKWLRSRDAAGGPPQFYQPSQAGTDNYTAFGIAYDGYPGNVLLGQTRIDYYIKFRGLTV